MLEPEDLHQHVEMFRQAHLRFDDTQVACNVAEDAGRQLARYGVHIMCLRINIRRWRCVEENRQRVVEGVVHCASCGIRELRCQFMESQRIACREQNMSRPPQ